ncbi:MAG: hypothetical protein HOK06_09270 [Rhodospirillaceae bacterium]|jgi:hypothetical protein|nr:hypothetical protein [Rhodospirillaceae bacterium]MBT4219015.1 hypothetical protein [Rhodospirillaceae bacterium]MBT4463504.1 hypothetical protein [Rhodospirillaceae bacterium]MBT5013893.1 hypothetical protein [Rhodospirillaceae bacterium]MBT5308223.1 hypothetical protein [Rhodospirillaceae bacterium]
MNLVYRPVNLITHDATGFFRCLPTTDKPDGTTVASKSLLSHDKDNISTAEKNAALLNQAFKDLADAFIIGGRPRLIVPLNSYALGTGDAATIIVQAFKELSEELRPAVIIELFDFPVTLTADILGDITIPVLPFFDKYMATPNPDNNDFTEFSNLNFFGVSLDLDASGATGEDAIADLTKFWAEATKRRLKVIVQGVQDQDVADKAQQYECFAMDGSLVGEDRPTLS